MVAAIFVLATYVISQVIGELAITIYPLLNGWSQQRILDWLQSSSLAQFFYIVVAEAAAMLFLYLFIRSYKVSFKDLGLVRPRLKDMGLALLAAPVYFGAFIALLSAVTALFPSIDVDQEQQIGFESVTGSGELLLTFVSLAILPPIVEEITMRGFLFTSLLKRLSLLWAAVITSILFGALHLQLGSGAPPLWVAAIDTFMLSMVLCYLRYKTGSLWPCIFLHFLKNGLAFSYLFLFPLLGIKVD